MNKNLLKMLSGAVIALSMLGTAIPAIADDLADGASRFVNMCDKNKDGMISKAEMMARAQEMMLKVEADKNGMVNAAKTMAFILELQRGEAAPAPAMMSKADVMKKIEAAFDKMDSKKAGMLDKKQLEVLLRELMKSGG